MFPPVTVVVVIYMSVHCTKVMSFYVRVRYVEWNFKGKFRNSTKLPNPCIQSCTQIGVRIASMEMKVQSTEMKLKTCNSWWRHETFSALLAICGEFPAQRPMTRSFDVFFDLRLNKRLSKQSWGWWFEALPRPLWRHSNVQNSCIQQPICVDITFQ